MGKPTACSTLTPTDSLAMTSQSASGPPTLGGQYPRLCPNTALYVHMYAHVWRRTPHRLSHPGPTNRRQRAQQSGRVPPSRPRQDRGSRMAEKSEDWRHSLPTERKLVWRTAEERRMSDLTRVLEWMERRQGKKKQALQVCTVTENLQGGLHSGQLKPDGMGRGAGLQHRGEPVRECWRAWGRLSTGSGCPCLLSS